MYTSSARRKYVKRAGSRGTGLLALLIGVLIGALLFSSAKVKEEPSAPETEALRLFPIPNEAEAAEESEHALETCPQTPEVELPSRRITVSADGQKTEMDIEEYLFGVVAGEMPASSEPEALRAQAVAARTFTALHAAGRARCKSGCTVCTDPGCCQAYLSDEELRTAWGEKYGEYSEKIRAAVRDTEGLVCVYGGELINAFYHASSGPATESSEEVFAMALPYLVSVDSLEGDREVVTRQEFTAAEVVRRINAAYPEANMRLPIGEHELEIWGRNSSGRVQLIRIGETVIPGGALRKVLGLKSTAFDIELDGDNVAFTCLGFGHGVGMSQTGANEMAKNGTGFEEILKHFYSGTELARLTYSD